MLVSTSHLLFGGLYVNAQSAPFASGASASQVGISGVPQDLTAVQLLEESIAKLGGATKWSRVHGVQVTGEIDSAVDPKTFVWVDDWSTGSFRTSRTTSGSTGTHKVIRSGQGARTVVVQHRTVPVPEVPLIERLAVDVPALSMLKAIEAKYLIVRGDECSTSRIACVYVYGRQGSSPLIKWYISTESGLPDHVQLSSPNLLYPRVQTWETVTYRTFAAEGGGIMIPEKVTIQHGRDVPTLLQFMSIQSNPVISPQESGGEIQ